MTPSHDRIGDKGQRFELHVMGWPKAGDNVIGWGKDKWGLPSPVFVPAGGTSITCSACGHQHKDNRQSRDHLRCVECGFTADADVNAAVQIARRGMMKPKKGDKIVDLHKNMVAGLRARDDGGLGPLLEGSGRGLVAAHVTEDAPDDRFGGDNASLGQKIIALPVKTRCAAYSQRGPAQFSDAIDCVSLVPNNGLAAAPSSESSN